VDVKTETPVIFVSYTLKFIKEIEVHDYGYGLVKKGEHALYIGKALVGNNKGKNRFLLFGVNGQIVVYLNDEETLEFLGVVCEDFPTKV
jgi:hypothetical protein